MLQRSNWSAWNGIDAPLPTAITDAAIAWAIPTLPEATKAAPQLAVELQSERCLNQLGQRLNACISALLAAAASPVEITIDHAKVQLAQVLVDELSAGLGEKCAIALQPPGSLSDRALPSEPVTTGFTVWATASGDSEPESNTAYSPSAVALRPFVVGQTLSDRDIQGWQAQYPTSSWQIHSQAVLGWLLLAPATPPPRRLSELESCLAHVKPRLIEQSLDRYTSALLQVELIQTQMQQRQELVSRNRELNQTNQLKSEFLANTSHEIRTPLSSILGFTHLMREQGFNPSNKRHQEYLNIILTSGQHLLALLNDILDLSKIEANQLDLCWETTAVKAVCETAMTLVREKASDKGLTLKLEIAPHVDTLIADALRLKQMLFNLLSNALKFTPKGSVGLQVSAIDNALRFTVWDTGTGISQDEQQLLFRPYSQIVNAAARRDEGTGLGLALTQKLAELHGGWVEVSSIPGQGSRFTIVLPLVPLTLDSGGDKPGEDNVTAVARSTAQLNPEAQPPAAVKDTIASACSPISITTSSASLNSFVKATRTPSRSNHLLLVEDNYYNAKLILTYLSRLGYEVTWVRDGNEMWQALVRALPALILMDINLPGEGGLALTQQLKLDDRYRPIPIIAQTAMAMTGDRDLCLEAGTIGYISKPIDLQALAKLIAQYVKGAKA